MENHRDRRRVREGCMVVEHAQTYNKSTLLSHLQLFKDVLHKSISVVCVSSFCMK